MGTFNLNLKLFVLRRSTYAAVIGKQLNLFYIYFCEIANLRYDIRIQILKHLNVDKKKYKIPNYFFRIRLYYVDLHIHNLMTESEMSLYLIEKKTAFRFKTQEIYGDK